MSRYGDSCESRFRHYFQKEFDRKLAFEKSIEACNVEAVNLLVWIEGFGICFANFGFGIGICFLNFTDHDLFLWQLGKELSFLRDSTIS